MKNIWGEEMYPLYHCRKCGYFFKDETGNTKDYLHGQQSEVLEIVCQKCQSKDIPTWIANKKR